MGFAKISSKLILCMLTLLFWTAAAGLGYIGANIFMTHDRYGDFIAYLHSIVPAVIIMGAALVMFLVGVVGFVGLFSENRCLLGIYFTFLSLLLSFEIAGVVLIFIYRQHVQKYVNIMFDDVLKQYGHENYTKMSYNFDYLQYKLQCCGENNYTDWQRTWWYGHAKDRWGNVPQSCCVNYVANPESSGFDGIVTTEQGAGISTALHFCTATSSSPTSIDNFYVDGCYTKLKDIIYKRFIYIAGFVMMLIVIQLIGIISTCTLMFCRNKHSQKPPYINIATNDEAQFNL